MGAFTFLSFLFHDLAWRFTLIIALEETSSDCLRNAGCGFAYVYVFCVRIQIFRTFMYGFCLSCAAFAYVYGFCASWGAFAYVYGLYFAHVVRILRTYTAYLNDIQRGKYRGIQSCRFLDFFCTYAHDSLTVSINLILRVPSIYFVRVRCSLLLDSIEDTILMVPSISFSARAARDSLSDLTSEVSCWSW